jgi:patatin-related protein
MSKKPDFSCEHRLGLVVYGGISLAIYMNGICQEFYNAVRGRGIYKLIKALTDADIVVDIVSGTSAGGINGVLLSYALANTNSEPTKSEIKFEKFSEVWKNSGDIQKLLFEKEYDKLEKASFFNGTGYYKAQVEQALKDRSDDVHEASLENNWFSEFEELDLFITGTDLLGRVYQAFDNTGSVIDVKDHHATFHLKYRDGGNDFELKNNDTTCEALAKLCQITSCFPVVFPPVTVKLDSKDDADKLLVKWGGLKKNRILPDQKPTKSDKWRKSRDPRIQKIDDDPGEGYRLHFVDGGVLDNRPFTHTIKEIYHRTAERPVFRKLFYVDPSPDCFLDNSSYQEMQKPDIARVALSSLIGMPRYESINNDLELIKEHNEKVRRYQFLLADIENLLDQDVPDTENKDIYDQQKNVYLRTRLISLKDKLLPLIFMESNDFLVSSTKGEERTKTLDKVAERLTRPFIDPERESQRLKLLEGLGEDIRDLDIDYALRRYLFIANYVYRLLDKDYLRGWLKKKKNLPNELNISKESLGKLPADLKEIIIDLNQRIKVLEAIKVNLHDLFSSDQMEKYFFGLAGNGDTELSKDFPEKFYKAMLWLHGNFLNLELPKNSTDANAVIKARKEKFLNIETWKDNLEKFLSESSQYQTSTLNELSKQSVLKKIVEATDEDFCSEKSVGEEVEYATFLKNKLKKYFCEFEKIDTFLYPLDYLGGVSEKQVIETYRISPEDAKLGLSKNIKNGERLKHKLAGDSLNAFGGFLKKSWRANDILWGRLDGLNRIIEALVSEETIKNFPIFLDTQAKKNRLSREQYLDSLLDEALYISVSNENTSSSNNRKNEDYLKIHKEEIKKKLLALFPNWDIQENTDKPRKILVKELVESLVFAGHIVILEQDFDDTMQVCIEEQLSWQSQKGSPPEPKIPTFDLKKGKFSSAVTLLVAKKFATESLASMSLEHKKDFFLNDYKIGLETLEDIPKPELRKITARFVRILQDVLRTWQYSSSRSRSTFWNRFGFPLLRFIIVVILNIFVRFL